MRVGEPGLVVALLPVEIVDVAGAEDMGAGAQSDDARAGGEGREQGRRPSEVAQVIGAELGLESIVGLAFRTHHHAGIVEEQVDGESLLDNSFGGLCDAGLRSEFKFFPVELGIGQFGAEGRQGCVDLFSGSACHGHGSPH